MDTLFLALLALVLGITLVKVWSRWRQSIRVDYIRTYQFPTGLLDRFGAHYPQLSLKERQLVARGLRQFFLTYLKGGQRFVAMPSQVVDDLWHEFILYTRHYETFCNQAFGGFLHHTPAIVLGPNRQNNSGLRRVWWYACLEENIDPKQPTRLPLLFALDEKLRIEDGFRYVLDCRGLRDRDTGGPVHCAGDMSSTDFDGTTDGFGDSSFGGDGDGGNGGDGGGCGGD